MPELPATITQAHSLFRAAAELDGEERRGFFYSFIGMANRVAVTDRLPLGDAETLPKAIEEAATVISQGLEHVATRNACSLTDTLRRVSLERLFRVGASLAGRKPPRDEAPQEAPDFDDEAQST